MTSLRLFLLCAAPVFAAGLGAQTYQWSPPNTGTIPGGSNNTIPFWGTSAAYQQVHDAVTMGNTLAIKGMGMRPSGSGSVTGRSWDLWIRLSHTTVSAVTATPTFSVNLGTGLTTDVFGSAAAYKTFSWPTAPGTPTNPTFTIPFGSPFLYLSALGNLCWDWRQMNSTVITTMAMDASAGTGQKGTTLPSAGAGCTATGSSAAATATMTSVQTAPPAYPHHLEIALNNGAASAGAMLALTLSPSASAIGWCAPVVTPLFLLPGTTDSSGSWVFSAPLSALAGSPSFNLYTQFGFADAALPSGLGVTDIAGFTTPNVPGAHGISRIYRSTYGGTTNGDELATSGSTTLGYGLSVGWLQ